MSGITLMLALADAVILGVGIGLLWFRRDTAPLLVENAALRAAVAILSAPSEATPIDADRLVAIWTAHGEQAGRQ